MGRRYLVKEGVAYKFKVEVLNRFKIPNDDQLRKRLWVNFLNILKNEHKISSFHAKTWKYPQKYLK